MENLNVVICLILVSFLRICNCQLQSNGQCFRNKSTSSSGDIIFIRHIFCCRNFEPKGTNNTCKECEFGFTSDGSKCESCPSGKYGEKCGGTCVCHDSERCHHKNGCVPDDTGEPVFGSSTTITTIHNFANEATTSRELTLVVIIVLLSLFIVFGLLHKCWDNLMNPLNCNDSKTNEIRNGHLQDDENIESVYNEIDELAMNTSRRSYHHSYLEITNSLSSTLHTKGSSTPSSICSTHLSSKSQPVQQKTLRRQRNELKEHTNDQHSPEGSEYSDEHIRPTSFVQLQPIEIMLEHRGISLPNNDTVTGIQNEYSISKESTLIGFGRSMRINKLTLKDVRSQTRRINVVDNPIYHETVNRHPKSAAWFSKRKTL